VVVSTAVISATVASASVYRAVKQIPVREIEVAHQFVVMSARPLPLGRRLEASDLKRVGWPASSPLPGAFSRIEDVVGRGLISAVKENEPMTDTKVDLLATVRRPADALTRVLVANVPVLTAGTRYEQEQGRDAKPIPSTVVTLVVTPGQAEKIALAAAEGQITLMLRNPVDVEEPATPGAQLARLVGEAPSEPAPIVRVAAPVAARRVSKPIDPPIAVPAPVSLPPPPVYTVEAIRAGKRTQETLP
jgi:Flp pilus assembly protein CpaB